MNVLSDETGRRGKKYIGREGIGKSPITHVSAWRRHMLRCREVSVIFFSRGLTTPAGVGVAG
jgi:hypothetical protein